MKYFTKEELEEITEKIIESPTREMLKELNDKYNVEDVSLTVENTVVNTEIPVSTEEPIIAPINNTIENQVIEPIPIAPVEQSVVVPLTSPQLPTNNMNIVPEIPSIEIPQQTMPEVNNTAEPINFTGNLWEPQSQQNELMSTTDSFNTPTQPSNTEIPVQNEQFFGNIQQQVNNPIPVSETMPNIPTPQGPSMFGQFEQNYNG